MKSGKELGEIDMERLIVIEEEGHCRKKLL